MRRHVRNRRNSIGSFIAENAGVTVVIFLGFIFPFVNLSTVALRFSILTRAVHDAANLSARCATFSTGSSTAPAMAVMDVVPPQVTASLAQTNGINVLSKTCRIITTPFATPPATPVATYGAINKPLPSTPSPDPTKNVYAVEVTVNADCNPLLMARMPFLPPIPGISGPMNFTVSSQEISENPSGLSQ